MPSAADGSAIAEIHQGYLGWPWVKNLRPAAADAVNAQAKWARAR
ncbi:MAG TPA: hypothetical protein VF306_17370 [Pirellulales bacterium]